MLQHSQNSSGQKEETDINQLVDEYLGLSYHGLRAKDKSFNATIKKELDPAIKTVKAIPQDIGRVLLNIYNNAFYAIAEKKKQNPANYEPTLTVRTKRLRNRVEISIMDNGNGIPEKVMDKIFQPFFTTKPAGQGTGLGLSLSYDIITKGHGGTMNVKTEEGQYTEMIIQLPS
jgi:signal transduction histidine kinase